MERERAVREVREAQAPALDLHPGYAPGSLSWTPHATSATPEDRIVTGAFRHLVGGTLDAASARELGREMARHARPDSLAEQLDAFSHLGIGRVKLTRLDAERYLFDGDGLQGAEKPGAPACAMALGFLEGAVEAATGQQALGAEMRCRSRGHEACAFIVMTR